MSTFASVLKGVEPRLKSLVSIQDCICGLNSPEKIEAGKSVIVGCQFMRNPEDITQIVGSFISAAQSRPLNIENMAKVIIHIAENNSTFKDMIRRMCWDNIKHPEIQFLVVHLIEGGLITPEYLISRVKRTKDLSLTPELIFYFLPEWSTDKEFFDELDDHKKDLVSWDKEYTAQSAPKMPGEELAANNFAVFKELRLKGSNHNSLAKAIRADNVDLMSNELRKDGYHKDMNYPQSIFDRNTYGKRKQLKIIEACAMFGAVKCLNWLIDNGATVPNELMRFAAHSGNHDLIRLCDDKGCSRDKAMLFALKAYHYTAFGRLYEEMKVDIDYASFVEMCKYKYKGLFYLLWKQKDISKIIGSDPSVNNDGRLLMKCAKFNNAFLGKVIATIDGFNVMTETGWPLKTALHVAAKYNAVEALRQIMMMSGANPNMNKGVDAPIILAAANNSVEAINEFILKLGVNLNIMSNGKSALMVACENGCVAAVKALAKAEGVDQKLKSADGKTALDFCKMSGARKCMNFLTE